MKLYENSTLEEVFYDIYGEKRKSKKATIYREIARVISIADPFTEYDLIQTCLLLNDYLRMQEKA